jgi:hypothetical protein
MAQRLNGTKEMLQKCPSFLICSPAVAVYNIDVPSQRSRGAVLHHVPCLPDTDAFRTRRCSILEVPSRSATPFRLLPIEPRGAKLVDLEADLATLLLNAPFTLEASPGFARLSIKQA